MLPAERQVEWADRRPGQPEDGYGDDVIDDQLREGGGGRLHRPLHGDRYRHRRGQEDRYHLPHRLPGSV
jgi:hypothetical protein